MDPAGSIIFDYGRAAAPVRGGRRIVPQAPTQTSVDNPLYFGPGGGVTHHSVIERTQNTAMERFENGPPPMQMPSWHAGKRSGADLPIGHKRTEKRTEYQHPNYQIHRSQHDTGVKDLLYSSASTAPTAPTAPMMAPPPLHGNHPIWPAYEFLASTMPTLPRDEDGNTQEGAALAALNACGLEISVDGLAELLARCDVAPEGFPPFSDFLLCLSRPHQQMLRASVSHGTTARLGVAPPQPVSSFPLGTKSKATMLGANGPDPTKKVHATSQQFTNSFGPDPFFF